MTDELGLKTQAEKRDEAYEQVREMMDEMPDHPVHLPEEAEDHVRQAYEHLLVARRTEDDYEKFGVDRQ